MIRVYRMASVALIVLGIAHALFTSSAYPGLTPETLWFAGTGLMLIATGLLNLRLQADRARRGAFAIAAVNGLALVLAVAAAYVIRQVHAYVLAALLVLCLVGSLRAEPAPRA
jgi:hypothetical protein